MGGGTASLFGTGMMPGAGSGASGFPFGKMAQGAIDMGLLNGSPSSSGSGGHAQRPPGAQDMPALLDAIGKRMGMNYMDPVKKAMLMRQLAASGRR
jgi:hypothetical protein